MTVGHHVDVSNLTEEECSKIINVISKDIVIRKSEDDRRTYLKKKFEDLRREILIANSRRKKRYSFDDYCLICGKHLFTFCCFLHRGEECISCEHFCCTSCLKVLVMKNKNDTERFYLCTLCISKRHLKYRTSEWFYEIFQKRFKRFGSAKALRAIYKQRKSIEPRVITLLALCRVLQPSRIHSLSTGRLTAHMSLSQDDDGVCYSEKSFTQQRASFGSTVEPQSSRRRYLSESEVGKLKEDSITFESKDEYKDATQPELCTHLSTIEDVTKLTDEMTIVEDNDDQTVPKKDITLDEWIAEGFETIEDCKLIDAHVFEKYDEYSESVPLLSISINKDESIDKEIYFNEEMQTKT